MPLSPLPQGGANPAAGSLPITSVDDVRALLPAFLRPDDPAPVRDAILAGITAMCLAIQDWAGYAAAQADVLRASGAYEDEIGGERGIARNTDDNEPYRARILSPLAVVTPTAILAAVASILAPYTSIQPRYCESRPDQMFAGSNHSVSPSPMAYVHSRSSVAQSPDYYDRGYPSESAYNGGRSRPGREPGAARVFGDQIGRLFVLRVPDISSINEADTPVYAESQTNGFFVGAGAGGSVAACVRADSSSASDVYANIINVVNRIKGQSMRFVLLVDPDLVA